MADHLRSASRTAHARTPGGALVHQLHRLLAVRALPGHHAGHLRRALVSHLLPCPGASEVGQLRANVSATPAHLDFPSGTCTGVGGWGGKCGPLFRFCTRCVTGGWLFLKYLLS